jgi:hypothetical protein
MLCVFLFVVGMGDLSQGRWSRALVASVLYEYPFHLQYTIDHLGPPVSKTVTGGLGACDFSVSAG